jgi:hypothetical protein
MGRSVVEREKLKFQEDPGLSPPWLVEPLYQCAITVTVGGFVPGATVEVEVDGATVISATVGFPLPVGATLKLPAALVVGQKVRARQRSGAVTSNWSPVVQVRDHTVDFPAGPPRPRIIPTPVYKCGSRTGVDNLLGGGNVWITADGIEVGRVDGCAIPMQGVNVNPDYGLGQRVRAWSSLCKDPSPPSLEHITQPGPMPLSAPGFEPIIAGTKQLVVTTIVNGARVSVSRNGAPLGTSRCWGGSLLWGINPPASVGETFTATQRLCASDPGSPPGGGGVVPCSSLPAPSVGPVQAGDTSVVITDSVPSATIGVYRNLKKVGQGSAPVVLLSETLVLGDVVHVVQDLEGCKGHLALQITVVCVDPPVSGDPTALDLFPIGWTEYKEGPIKGSVYYPAEDDGEGIPFNERLGKTGPCPIVFMAHGNHDPADPSYLGYDYFQRSLAKMGIIAVSVDCNALNGSGGGVSNIEARADLVIDSIRYFQKLAADPASTFNKRIDFARVGLMGHSRGGDAVVTIPTVIGSIGVTIRAVLALAPTNFRYWAGMSTIKPSGYAFMTILPAADGDVVDNNGAQFYDQAAPGPFKSQVYVHSTNHNFYNRRWLNNDGVTAIIPRSDHERVLDAYGCALFRATLAGHSTRRYLDGQALPGGVPTSVVHLSCELAKQVTVDNHEDKNTISVNSLSQPTSQTGGLSANEYPFDQVPPAFSNTFYGLSVGMVATSKPGGIFRSTMKPTDVRRMEVWIRTAEVVRGAIPSGAASGFELGLEDDAGLVAWVNSDDVGGVPRPFARPAQVKTMLNTLRFKTACFTQGSKPVDLKSIRAILIRLDRNDQRALAFDDLQLVKP